MEVETKGWKSKTQRIIKAVLIFDVLQFYINIWKISKKQNQLVNTRPGVGQCLGLPWQTSTGTPQLLLIPFPSSTESRRHLSHSSRVGTRGAVWFLFRSFLCQRWVLGWRWPEKRGKRGLWVLKNELKNCLKVIRCFVLSPALAGFQAAFWNKTQHDNIAQTLNKEIN